MIDWRGPGAKNTIWGGGVDVICDGSGVEVFDDRFAILPRNHSVLQKGLNHMTDFRPESVLHGTRARVEANRVVGRMALLKGLGEELRGKKAEMFVHWKNFRFGVEVVNRRGRMGASDVTQGSILNHLEAIDRRV